MTDDLIALHGCEQKLMPLLNLPVQSGSNKILKKMNRKYTREDYIEIIEKLRTIRKDIIFSSDFIVGFPGETDDDFEQTLQMIKQVKFEGQSFSSKYSPRIGTPAAEQPQIDEEIKKERLKIVQSLLEEQRLEFNKKFVKQKVKVLFDNINSNNANQITGRTEFMQICVVDLPATDIKNRIVGNLMEVEIVKMNQNSFQCKFLTE